MIHLLTFGIVCALGVMFLFLLKEQISRIEAPYPLPWFEALKKFKVNLILIFLFWPVLFSWAMYCISMEPSQGIALAGTIAIFLTTLVMPMVYPYFAGKVRFSYVILDSAVLVCSTALWVGILSPIADELNLTIPSSDKQTANRVAGAIPDSRPHTTGHTGP